MCNENEVGTIHDPEMKVCRLASHFMLASWLSGKKNVWYQSFLFCLCLCCTTVLKSQCQRLDGWEWGGHWLLCELSVYTDCSQMFWYSFVHSFTSVIFDIFILLFHQDTLVTKLHAIITYLFIFTYFLRSKKQVTHPWCAQHYTWVICVLLLHLAEYSNFPEGLVVLLLKNFLVFFIKFPKKYFLKNDLKHEFRFLELNCPWSKET